MMPLIDRIEIVGFRGIHAPLTLEFKKGSAPQSMIILGRNGHGKSSITDSWEWFHTGNIDRLNKEDAKQGSFPHRKTADDRGECYVSVRLADGTDLKQSYSHKTITKPSHNGDIAGFRERVPHPCHLRHDDLTKFVYKSKTNQHDELAHLMGFDPQVQFQKQLNRILRQVKEKVESQSGIAKKVEDELSGKFGGKPANAVNLIAYWNIIIARHGLDPIAAIDEVTSVLTELEDLIEKDPGAKELAELESLRHLTGSFSFTEPFGNALLEYSEGIAAFKAKETAFVDATLIGLYETGQQILAQRQEQELQVDVCPLCGKDFDGDLLDHLSVELENLRELKDDLDGLERTRKVLLDALTNGGNSNEAVGKNVVLAAARLSSIEVESSTLDFQS
jgi:hypothetical protein